MLAIQRQPGTNTIEVVDAIQRAHARASGQQLPAAVNLNVLYDRSVAIRESVHDVAVHPGCWPSRWWCWSSSCSCATSRRRSSRASPCRMSIIGTFAVMYVLGYTIDIISLDGAHPLRRASSSTTRSSCCENIVRHMEEGMRPDGGGADRRQRDRLHHHVDDRSRWPPSSSRAVHGRRHGPAAPRVRGGHRRGGARVGLRVADPDADGLQPLPAPAGRVARTALPGLRALLRRHAARLRRSRSSGRCATAVSRWP